MPGKSHGWRSLVGYSPWGRKELDTTERLHFASLYEDISRVGLGPHGGSAVKNPAAVEEKGAIPGWGRSPGENSNPLEYSCLEKLMDRGAWQATVYEGPKAIQDLVMKQQ